MKKTTLCLLATLLVGCILLSACNAGSVKTLNQVASSATTLTEEIKKVFESGGTVDFSEIKELDSVEVIERELVAFDFDMMLEVMSPLSPEFDKMNCDQTPLLELIASGCFHTCAKNTVKADGKEYVVYSLLSYTTEKTLRIIRLFL